jgi:S1-C subfamily serine protease
MFETLKNYLGVIVYIFIITLLFFSCTSFKINKKEISKPVTLMFDQKFEKGANNFVFLLKEYYVTSESCENFDPACINALDSTASGLVLSSNNNSIFVLTASHFCDSKNELNDMFPNSRIIGIAGDRIRSLNIVNQDRKNDICLLQGVKYENEKFHNIKLAETTTIGEDVYAVAAPLGIAAPENRLIFTGQLAGCNSVICMTTIPATFGSSGGGIYNSNHELISIVMAVPGDFDNVILSPSIYVLEEFISHIDFQIDIYNE